MSDYKVKKNKQSKLLVPSKQSPIFYVIKEMRIKRKFLLYLGKRTINQYIYVLQKVIKLLNKIQDVNNYLYIVYRL